MTKTNEDHHQSKYSSSPGHVDHMIGDKLCVLHKSWVEWARNDLAEMYRAQGLTGDTLEKAINNNLPQHLAKLIPNATPVTELTPRRYRRSRRKITIARS